MLREDQAMIQTALDSIQELQQKLVNKTAAFEIELADLEKVLPGRLEVMPQAEQQENTV